jgi:Polyketide cyclase / dehydrase and lipid transport
MASNEYHFITNWKVKGTCREVYNILSDSEALAKWWPAVYLDVKEIEKGDENSIGKKVKLYTKGWLPYTIQWDFEVVENIEPRTFTIRAYGDFVGRGIWLLEKNGDGCNVSFDWKLEAEKPLLKKFSFIMKPIFSANHKWAMKKGEKSLELELLRQRPGSIQVSGAIPAPPQPTFPHNFTHNKIL